MLTGCSQDESQDSPGGSGRAISFRAQGGTGGLKATTTGGDYIHSFVVNAIRDDGTPGVDKQLLTGTTVYRNEGVTGWTYAPEVFYPTVTGNNYVEFFAYSPSGSRHVNPGLGAAGDDPTSQVIGYSVPVPASTGATAQEDLLVAYGKVLKAGYESPVKLQFRHALSRILVAAKSEVSAAVTITGLELKNVYSTGELNLKGNGPSNTGASDGIPVSETTGTELTDWSYNAPASITATTDYVTLWENPGDLIDYPYVLPASGVSVAATSQLVTSAEQGMFVLPQTTEGDLSDTDPTGEFALLVNYTLNGAPQTPVTVQFADLNGIGTLGVTFEIGRQYVLNLEFKSDGNVKIGAAVSFGDIDADLYGTNINVPIKTVWARSNVYFKPDTPGGVVGALTFEESGTDKQKYQGLYFKWGSLIGIAGGAVGAFDNDTYLYIPDLTTGKYYKVKSGEITNTYSAGTGEMNAAVTAYATMYTDGSYTSIPFTTSTQIDNSASGEGDRRLTLQSNTLKASYLGDVCKFISDHPATAGLLLARDWVLPYINPVGSISTWTLYNDPGASFTDANGTDDIQYWNNTATTDLTRNFWPNAYYRDGSSGELIKQASSYYSGGVWAAPAGTSPDQATNITQDTDSRRVTWGAGGWDRPFGLSVRCVSY
ncbi:hypothetical protein JCM30204_41140 [Dysgonomonas termitidis]